MERNGYCGNLVGIPRVISEQELSILSFCMHPCETEQGIVIYFVFPYRHSILPVGNV
jgi:hypothetical protein